MGLLLGRLSRSATLAVATLAILFVAASAAVAAVAAEVRTDKQAYVPSEPIIVHFGNAPDPKSDWVALAPEGAPEVTSYNGEFLRGVRSGSKKLLGLVQPGRYEARLFDGRTGKVVARYPFTIGTPTAKAEGTVKPVEEPKAGPKVQPAAPGLPPKSGAEFKIGLPKPGIAGSWLAHITCVLRKTKRGDETSTSNAILEIAGRGDLRADLYILWQSANGTAQRMSGTHDPVSGKVRLEAKEWIYQPGGGIQPVNIAANLDASGLRMNGQIENVPNCTSFQAVKFVRDERPTNQTGIVPLWQRHKQASVRRDTCVPFLTWSAEGSLVSVQRQDVPSQVLDSAAFYKFMGVSYDRWKDEYRMAYYAFVGHCMQNFQNSKEIALTSLATKANNTQFQYFLAYALPDRPNPRPHLGYLSNYARVVSLRSARLYADLSVQEARTLPSTRENRDRVASALASISQGAGLFAVLPPEERQRYAGLLTEQREKIVQLLSKDALAKGRADIERIRAMPDAQARLAALKSIHAGKADYSDMLLPRERGALADHLKSVQRATASQLIGAALSRVETAPEDRALLAAIEKVESEVSPVLALLIDEVANEFRERIERRKQSTFDKLADEQRNLLRTYRPDRVGLAAAARWPPQFAEAFASMRTNATYQKAMEEFRSFRNRQLQDAIPVFEAELKAVPDGPSRNHAIATLLPGYLAWEGDVNLPSALEYQLIAVGLAP